jgi:NADH-quinone oxidoreductase subunit N
MSIAELTLLLPYILVAATAIVVMMGIAFYRHHAFTLSLTLCGLALALGATFVEYSFPNLPVPITPLLIMDRYSLFFTGLFIATSIGVALLAYSYLKIHGGDSEEFYLLLLIATLGCMVLAAATHFATFFLGIEILSVSLYALAAYLRHRDRSVEAGVKYLILAAVSSAFILFGMALVYAETGSLELNGIASYALVAGVGGLPFLSGISMILVGLGFKLAVVPFHLWTPDVYEGAPAPVTAFIATVSKGAVFALVLRFFSKIDIHDHPPLFMIVAIVAIASMFMGNLLALLQQNVKRILAYSSISHLGYLLVTLLASGGIAITAAELYLTAYVITTLGAFGVITVLSGRDRDADTMDDYIGLAWKRPWLAAVFTAMLFSLAGIPLTAGFMAKYYIVAAGAGSGLWGVIIILVINSVIGLFYYLRIIVSLFAHAGDAVVSRSSCSGSIVLAVLTILLIWIGVYPVPVIVFIQKTVSSLM